MKASGLLLSLLTLTGCPGGSLPISETVGARFSEPSASAASTGAPLLFRQAEEARAAAEAAENRGDTRAAEDHATQARLLLDAAIAESERREFDELRLVEEGETLELEEALAREQRQEREARNAALLVESQRVAREQAQAAFERAATDEGRRYRGRSAERTRLHREASGVLRRRAQLYAAAAERMGAGDEILGLARTAIEASAQSRDAAESMARADEAVRLALSALGAARQQRPGPTMGEITALSEASEEYGFTVQVRPEGTSIRVSGLFRGNSLAPAAATHLDRISALLAAHPHGPVQVVVHGGAAEAQATALSEGLSERHSEHAERTTVETGETAVDAAVEFRFPAYAPVRE